MDFLRLLLTCAFYITFTQGFLAQDDISGNGFDTQYYNGISKFLWNGEGTDSLNNQEKLGWAYGVSLIFFNEKKTSFIYGFGLKSASSRIKHIGNNLPLGSNLVQRTFHEYYLSGILGIRKSLDLTNNWKLISSINSGVNTYIASFKKEIRVKITPKETWFGRDKYVRPYSIPIGVRLVLNRQLRNSTNFNFGLMGELDLTNTLQNSLMFNRRSLSLGIVFGIHHRI